MSLSRYRVSSIEGCFDREFIQSKPNVNSIEGLDRRVSYDENWDSMLDYSSFFYPLPSLVKIFVGSSKILEDLHEDPYADLRRSLWNILKDLKGSFKFLPRSSRTSPISLKILEGLCMYVEDLCRNFVNPWSSLQIFDKILTDLWQDPDRSLQDPDRSLQDPERSLQDLYRSL